LAAASVTAIAWLAFCVLDQPENWLVGAVVLVPMTVGMIGAIVGQHRAAASLLRDQP
jgi:hypothetical protein